MDRATFFNHFELLAGQSDAVAKMRELVWQLAVQGKLLSQNPKDEPATKLAEQILEQKSRLTKAGKIRKTPLLPPIEASDHHFKIPPSWAWVHLNDIGDWGSGSTPERGRSEFYGGDIPWLKSGELNDGYVAKSEEHLTKLALEKCSLRLNQPGDVLIAMYGATVGKVAILDIVATTNQAVCACTCFDGVYNRYLFLLLKAYKQRFIDESAGAAQPNFSKDKIIRTIAPLPPLAEQRRIVAKVDELMALCDELEQRQQARQHASGILQQSALHHLLAAREPQTFAAAWQRVRDHFHLLHDTPDAILQLRQAILQFAVQGRLVPTQAKRTFGSLESILAEASANGVSKGPTTDTSATEILRISAGTSRKDFYVDEDDFKHVDLLPEWIEKYRLQPDDLLGCRFNGNLHFVGRFSLYRGQSGRVQVNSDKLIRFRIDSKLHCPRYVCFAMNAPTTREAIEAMCATTAGNIGLSAGKLKTVEIPLPPLAEQKRVVARVEELLRWCDTLEAQLHQTGTLGAQLLASTLHHLLAA